MAEKNPPAFPVHFIDREGDLRTEEQGMALRDYFATAACSALLAKITDDDLLTHGAPKTHAMVAHVAYLMADAMLTERQKTK